MTTRQLRRLEQLLVQVNQAFEVELEICGSDPNIVAEQNEFISLVKEAITELDIKHEHKTRMGLG